MKRMKRYVIADPGSGSGWSHIWQDDQGEVERTCRFVFDRDSMALLDVAIDVDGSMVPAATEHSMDLLDSLLNANPDALDDPEAWGLELSDRLPSWCGEPDQAIR